MKKFFITAILFLSISKINTTNAQVGIGVTTANVNPSAQLEVLSTTKGLLPPRMTTSQRDAINGGSPAEGLVIYNTTKKCMQFKSDTGWVSVIPSTGTSSNANATSVTIGSQIWATKNLSVDRYRNGDIIPQVTSGTQWAGLTTGAWCWYNDDSANYAAIYGRLYNGYAVKDPRGLAPAGWHIPSSDEWTTLATTLGNTAAGSMKNTIGWILPNKEATNSSGFEGLPGGERYNGFICYIFQGIYNNIGSSGNWWSSTLAFDNNSYLAYRSLSNLNTFIGGSNAPIGHGFSVRCILDLIPTLNPTSINSIAFTSAASGGNITSDGGATITARGVCWSTTANPTVSLSTKTVDGVGTGTFTSNITGLASNTTYYVRAYATNSAGTAYGAQQTFTTINDAVTIGNQAWATQNLSVARYRNGDIIPNVTDATQWQNLTTGAWCWYNNDSATYATKYGRLYNWYAVNDSRGLAPLGFHIPSSVEINTLISTLGGSSQAGGALKSTTNWNAPNTGATNSSGFAGLPGGLRFGSFSNIGNYGYWWSSTGYQTTADNFGLSFDSKAVSSGGIPNNCGFSVRCIKD